MPPIAYHITDGPHAFQFDADARHAVLRHPGEWSRSPWPAATSVIEQTIEPDITTAIEALTDRTVAFRRASAMDRLSAKLEAAAGVVGRVTADLEQRADLVIAREAAIGKRSEQLFAAKHSILNDADAGLDGIEAKLSALSNDPLDVSGPSPSAAPDMTTDKPA
jgi:hypothetical protein